jgi:hypothetical protein
VHELGWRSPALYDPTGQLGAARNTDTRQEMTGRMQGTNQHSRPLPAHVHAEEERDQEAEGRRTHSAAVLSWCATVSSPGDTGVGLPATSH